MNVVRKAYNWVLSWADSRWGLTALFFLALFEASFFPVPPDVLLIALCLGCTKKSFKYAAVCLAGSFIGAAFGYAIGFWAWEGISHWFIPGLFSQEAFDSVGATYDKWNFWAIFTAGFTPIPFKIFTIAAGVFKINFPLFMLATLIGRGMRFFLLGWMIWKFGAPIKVFIDKYFNWIVLAVTVLLVGGFVLIKYVM